MRKVSSCLLVALLACVTLPAHAERIGKVGSVNVSAFGTPPNAQKRPLQIGAGLEKRERIETNQDGTTQVLFNDTSTMTVGRNSSVVLDDFVYSSNGGAQGVTLAKGVMRFVGGGVSHQSGAGVRTPTASIAIRGGSAVVRATSDGTLIVHQNGRITLEAGGETRLLTRAGFGVFAPVGGPMSEPFRVSPETIAALNAALDSRHGQTGGARRKPTNQLAESLMGAGRPSNVETSGLMEALNVIWSGNALVESKANAENQQSAGQTLQNIPAGGPPQPQTNTGPNIIGGALNNSGGPVIGGFGSLIGPGVTPPL
jgi:hypothetical protein